MPIIFTIIMMVSEEINKQKQMMEDYYLKRWQNWSNYNPKNSHQNEISQNNKQISSRSKLLLPSPHERIQHQHGDWKGRDFFVTFNDGGQVDLHKCLLPTQLRNYEKQYSLPDATKYLINNEKLKSQTQVNLFRQREMEKKLSEPKLQLSPSKQSLFQICKKVVVIRHIKN
ncbi:hypothetical protein pb186bvf_005338 [Paramecium bursaria]